MRIDKHPVLGQKNGVGDYHGRRKADKGKKRRDDTGGTPCGRHNSESIYGKETRAERNILRNRSVYRLHDGSKRNTEYKNMYHTGRGRNDGRNAGRTRNMEG